MDDLKRDVIIQNNEYFFNWLIKRVQVFELGRYSYEVANNEICMRLEAEVFGYGSVFSCNLFRFTQAGDLPIIKELNHLIDSNLSFSELIKKLEQYWSLESYLYSLLALNLAGVSKTELNPDFLKITRRLLADVFVPYLKQQLSIKTQIEIQQDAYPYRINQRIEAFKVFTLERAYRWYIALEALPSDYQILQNQNQFFSLLGFETN